MSDFDGECLRKEAIWWGNNMVRETGMYEGSADSKAVSGLSGNDWILWWFSPAGEDMFKVKKRGRE